MTDDDLDRDWMPDPIEAQAKEAAKLPPDVIADAADLPDDVADGDIEKEN